MTCLVALACRPADHVAVVHIPGAVNVGAGIEQNADALEVAIRRGEMQRAGVVTGIASVGIRAVLEQQPHRRRDGARPGAARCCPQRRARERDRGSALQAARASASTSPAAHARMNSRDVRRPPAIDLRLQRAPARESVLARHRELRRRRASPSGFARPQRGQPLLRELLQVFVGRAFGEIERT